MNKIIAYSLSDFADGYASEKWDFGLLHDTFARNSITVKDVKTLPRCDRAFVIVPGFEWSSHMDDLNRQLKKIKRVVLFITADEVGVMDVDKIQHPNIEIWVQYPYQKHRAYNLMPVGSPSQIHDLIPKEIIKDKTLFFSGQNTHPRRNQLISAIEKMDDSLYNATAGFTQGYPAKDYYAEMTKARIVPAPAGAASIDTFRFYEGLESLAIPIADEVSRRGDAYGFWDLVFNEIPVPKANDWEKDLESIVKHLLGDYNKYMHRAVSWWIKYKRDFSLKVMEQINEG